MISNNKISKYVLYAIGEIMLVVIGILIALQINNSNELRKERAIEVNYLKNLKADLLLEIKNNETFSSYRISKAKSCINLLNCKIPQTIEDVKQYTDEYENIFIWEAFVPNNNTFKELLGSGNLSLIKNDSIKNSLLELDNLYAYVSNGEFHMRREYEKYLYDRSIENIESLAFFDKTKAQYGIPLRLTIKDIPKSNYQKLISDAQWLYNDQTFNNGIRLALLNNGGLAEVHNNMNDMIKILLNQIDDELKK